MVARLWVQTHYLLSAHHGTWFAYSAPAQRVPTEVMMTSSLEWTKKATRARLAPQERSDRLEATWLTSALLANKAWQHWRDR